jgi:hypothetical protein
VGIVLPFLIKMMICFNGFALFINIIGIFLIVFCPLNVCIAFGGQDPKDEGIHNWFNFF